MKKRVTTALYFLVGLVNLAPIPGAAGQKYLETLYGVSISSPDLLFLMQHRALLFGVVGGLLVVAAFLPIYRKVAMAAGLFSMISFILLYAIADFQSDAILKACLVDAIAVAFLGLAWMLGERRSGLRKAPPSVTR
ncbi:MULTISPECIES: hypothetical protein [Kordiimonas]|nr:MULTISPECIES: hypothetical protein [Kordiimonas]